MVHIIKLERCTKFYKFLISFEEVIRYLSCENLHVNDVTDAEHSNHTTGIPRRNEEKKSDFFDKQNIS